MPEYPSYEEVRQEVLNLLKDWGKDFGEYGEYRYTLVSYENPITFEAILDAINIVNACSLKYEVKEYKADNVLKETEGDTVQWVFFTLTYPPSTHFQDFVTASKSYIGLDNHLRKIGNAIQDVLWPIVDKYSLGYAPVLVEPERDSTPRESTTSEVAQIEQYKVWENLRFRSESEIRIAQALDKVQGVLFFPNAKARLGHPRGRENREPDFLVCYKGKWGILEVDGPSHHQAAKDHARDRLFKLHGISFVEHFEATDCYENPERVVQQFLYLLSQVR